MKCLHLGRIQASTNYFISLHYHSKIIALFAYFSPLQCSAAANIYVFPNFSPLSCSSGGALVHVLFVRSSPCSQNVRSGKYTTRRTRRRPPGRPPSSSSPWAWARRRRSSCSTRTFFPFCGLSTKAMSSQSPNTC